MQRLAKTIINFQNAHRVSCSPGRTMIKLRKRNHPRSKVPESNPSAIATPTTMKKSSLSSKSIIALIKGRTGPRLDGFYIVSSFGDQARSWPTTPIQFPNTKRVLLLKKKQGLSQDS